MPYEKSSPSSPEAQSASPIQDNLKALAALFPSVVRDGQVDVDALRQLCGEAVVKENELFGLNWRGKAEARRAALTPSLGTLRPCKEESKDWDTTQNLYIEGDNLEVLKLLRKSYGGKVKMIYIDPPYNTGKEFVYPDDYQNGIENYKKLTGQEGKYAANVETSGRYHTDWLNMMYPRLILARELLREDGVIFISIDDNEIGDLIKICDEVFGELNFVGCISRATGTTTGQDANKIGSSLDYCLVYSRTNVFSLNGIPMDEKDLKRFNAADGKGSYSILQLRKTGNADTREDRPNMFYPILAPDGTEVFPFGPSDYLSRWRVAKNTYEAWVKDNLIVWKKNPDTKRVIVDGFIKSQWTPYVKYYLEGRTKQVSNLIQDIEGNKKASIVLKNLLGAKGVFDNPKPVEFLSLLSIIGAGSDSIIIDFFSGSATTAHAVMQLNAEDDGNRRFIMVQLPEPCEEKSEAYKAGYKNICEIGKERIRRAGMKVKEEAGLAGQNLDIGFRVYKLDSSNVKAWNPQAEDLATAVNNYAEHLVGGRTEDDFLTEIMLKSGIDLTEKVAEREIAGHRVQSLGYGQYYACMAEDLADDAEEVALGIAAWHEEDCSFAGGEQQDTCTVFVADRAFESNDAAKMNFVAILEQHGICNIKAL